MPRRKPDKGATVDYGTPELRKKLKASVVLRLAKQGRITDQEYFWIMEIEDAAETLTSVANPLGSNPESEGTGRSSPSIVGHLTDAQRVRVTRFIHWQDKVKKEFSARELAAVMEIIIDNLGINEAERVYGLGQRNGVRTFRKIISYWG